MPDDRCGHTLRAAREDGIRQAIEWLRADYEYGTGPDWRENGAEWIAERAAEERAALAADDGTGQMTSQAQPPGCTMTAR